MAFQVFSYIVLFLLYCDIAEAHLDLYETRNIISTPLEFLNQLNVGVKKGDNINGVYELKKYLSYFGYHNFNRNSTDQNQEHQNIFDDSLEIALRRYQQFYGLNITGSLDAGTIEKMQQPRCGVPYFINPNYKNSLFHTISHYSFFPGHPKWYRKNLSYGFDRNVNKMARLALQRALNEWALVTPFKFNYIRNISLADIQISFERGDHGDGFPFGVTVDVVAHTFAPPDGRIHFDVHQNWSYWDDKVNGNAIDLRTVALQRTSWDMHLGLITA